MRRKVVAGNWKMNNDLNATKNLISNLLKSVNQNENCEIIICPPFTSLSEASIQLKNSSIKLGAQNMYFENDGAYTGEISAQMLLSAGCEFVILGHSERRAIFKESNSLINKKMKKAISSGLKPIFCIGETLDEREKGVTKNIIKNQVTEGLKDILGEELKSLIVAYEPVWAIGTGRNATPDQAQEVHEYIRSLIEQKYSKELADNLIIQYGGSVKADNAKDLLSQKDIDGALVGGASLKAESFLGIIRAA